MSAQTGTVPPSGPTSRRLVDQVRYRVDRLKNEPNPIWMRELRQSARLGRTPIFLTVVTVLMTFLMASIGGIASTDMAPAKTGVILFQVFFSLAYFVVTLVGPAVASNSIASEREGRTWEAVLLTGIPPGEIARGKFLAAYTAIGMYVVMLAPVGALPFLFGGVTATEVVVAFLFLFLISLLSVAFGLAISSKMTSLRVAILVTLLLAFPMAACLFSVGGFGLSYAAHRAWPEVADGPPIWLPTAYQRAPFGVEYAVFLVLLPIVSVVIPAWFLYEVTIANLSSASDDRSTRLKTWFLASTPVLAFVAAIPAFTVGPRDAAPLLLAGMCAMLVFLTFSVFLFAGDPISPSRRVEVHWDRRRAGRLRRFLGPGVMRSAGLLLLVGVVVLGALTAAGLPLVRAASAPERAAQEIGCFSAYALAFYVFLVGLASYLRARSGSPLIARILLLTLLFAIAVVPWVVAAVAGLIAEHGAADDALVVAAPSPFYVFVMIAKLTASDPTRVLTAGFAAAAGWLVLGLGLLAAARARCATLIAAQSAAFAQMEALLAQEDQAAALPPAAPEAPADDAGALPGGPGAGEVA